MSVVNITDFKIHTPEQKAAALLNLIMSITDGPVEAIAVVYAAHRIILREMSKQRSDEEADKIESDADVLASTIVDKLDAQRRKSKVGEN